MARKASAKLPNPGKLGANGAGKKAAFLALMAEGMPIKLAAKAAGVSHNTPGNWRKNDPEFRKKYEAALSAGAVEIVREVKRRAIEGTRKPMTYKGMLIEWTDPETGKTGPLILREYSDTLLMFLAKARDPETFDDAMRLRAWERRNRKRDEKDGAESDTPAADLVDLLAKIAAKKAAEASDEA